MIISLLIIAIALLLLISVLPVAIVGGYVYKQDQNKEPKGLLKKLFWAGVFSTVISLLITNILQNFLPILNYEFESLNLLGQIVYVFIGIALVEEFSKWIMVYRTGYRHPEFDEIYDAIVYTVFVSLGFACLENILYVFTGGIGTGIIRAFISVPGHACDGILMGYFFGMAKYHQIHNNRSKEIINLVSSILAPTIISHGLFDFFALTKNTFGSLLFWVFIAILFKKSYGTVKKVAQENKQLSKEEVRSESV